MIENFLKTKTNSDLLCRTILGLERETIRTTREGFLSLEPHPRSLGSAFRHPLIKTDFSEAQLEYATKPSYRIESVLRSLEQLHNYTVRKLASNEFLWPFSMPPRLPENEDEIPLALYGNSPDAIKKTIYRRGLGFRYGRKMQTISGVHINISFSKFFLNWASKIRYNQPLSYDTQNQLYLDTIRNFNRYSFLLIYLFGSSPSADRSFCRPYSRLKPWKSDTYLNETATSIRLSELGYTSTVQNSLNLSFNAMDEYLDGMSYAISTIYPPYSKYNNPEMLSDNPDDFSRWNQLNDCYLQIENEYYSLIRPKQIADPNERPIEALRKRGIRYLEVRCIDSDPFSSSGVSMDMIAFSQLFLLYCLLKESPSMSREEKKDWESNQFAVVWSGRDLGTKYTVLGETKGLREWFLNLYSDLERLAIFWDHRESCNRYKSTLYSRSLQKQRRKIEDPGETPSGKILSILKSRNLEFVDLGKEMGLKYRSYWMENPLDSRIENKLDILRRESLDEP